ncbi:MAG: hypothetical protein RLZZ500_1014 [Bacteroidota bacterium]|jgi:hypothetical protein
MKKIYPLVLLFIAVSLVTSCAKREGQDSNPIMDWFRSDEDLEQTDNFIRYQEPELSATPLVLSLFDDQVKYSRLYNAEIRKACDYSKLPFNCVSENQWNSTLSISEKTRVIMVYNTRKLSDAAIAKLFDFVMKGGHLFVPFASEDKRMAFLYGFKPEAEYATNTKALGWHFNTPILPGLQNKNRNPEFKLFGFDAQNFSDKVTVLATSITDPSYPTIVENKIGLGRVLLYNTSGDFGKIDRGFLFAGVLKGLENVPYPIANTATVFLDDFPAPQYDIKAEPILSEMNLSTADFISKVWWPDMSKLATEFDIPYAAMLTFDYRNKIVPPFTLDQWNSMKIKNNNHTEALPDWFVHELKKGNHELAFHGYNHVSLTKKLWPDKQMIETSMSSVKKKWELSNYGKFPTTYVPPSNEIDAYGVQELKYTMPSLKYMCSLFLGQKEEGGDREFDYDPYSPNFFDYPRISSGFYFSDDENYATKSMYLFTGVWTHFVHPDDVFQIPATANKSAGGYNLRNRLNYGWRKSRNAATAMYPEFKSFISDFKKVYPQMHFVNGNDGGTTVMKWRASRYTHQSNKEVYTVSQTNAIQVDNNYWFMFGSREKSNQTEAALRKQGYEFSKSLMMNGFLYSIKTPKDHISITDYLEKETSNAEKLEVAVTIAKNQYSLYKKEVARFLSGGIWEDEFVKKHELELLSLKYKMLDNAVIDSTVWNKYAKYLSWEDKGADVWTAYEKHVAKFPFPANILYSIELDRVIGYPNDVVKEKWMFEHTKVAPNSIEILKAYVANFNTDENKDKIKPLLQRIFELEPTLENHKNYINHLLAFYPQEAKVAVDIIKPSKDWDTMATTFTWMYADAGDFKKALEWAAYSSEIAFKQKMQWYVEMGQSAKVIPLYNDYIKKNPNDNDAKELMATIYHGLGKFTEAWTVANGMGESPAKEELRKTLNKDVVYEEMPVQQLLIDTQVQLFYPEVLKKLTKSIRLEYGDFVDYKSGVETNQADPSIFKNVLSYNRLDAKKRTHTFGITYTNYYEIDFRNGKRYDFNTDNSMGGLEYQFRTAPVENKAQYWTRTRFELSKATELYFQAAVGLNKTKGKNYYSAELSAFPAETASAMNQKIYDIRLTGYYDTQIFKKINLAVTFEGDYYTDGMLSRDTIFRRSPGKDLKMTSNAENRIKITELPDGSLKVEEFDASYSGHLSARLLWDEKKKQLSKFIPFVEGQFMLGSRDLQLGYPYWMLKERLFGGGGLGWELTTENLKARLEGGYFFDDFAKNFKRFTGSMSYQLLDFTALTVQVEFFNQQKYYSNAVSFGLKHNFKPRKRR